MKILMPTVERKCVLRKTIFQCFKAKGYSTLKHSGWEKKKIFNILNPVVQSKKVAEKSENQRLKANIL